MIRSIKVIGKKFQPLFYTTWEPTNTTEDFCLLVLSRYIGARNHQVYAENKIVSSEITPLSWLMRVKSQKTK